MLMQLCWLIGGFAHNHGCSPAAAGDTGDAIGKVRKQDDEGNLSENQNKWLGRNLSHAVSKQHVQCMSGDSAAMITRAHQTQDLTLTGGTGNDGSRLKEYWHAQTLKRGKANSCCHSSFLQMNLTAETMILLVLDAD
jgi:hypothetical protein